MSAVRQRNVALGWSTLLWLTLPLLACAWLIHHFSGRYAAGRFLCVPFAVAFLYLGVQRLLWWWGVDLRIDDQGIRLGGRRRRPPQLLFVARAPYLAGWDAVSDARLVSGRSAAAAMSAAARPKTLGPQPSIYLGYFPVRGRPHLVFEVDLAKVSLPQVRPPATRTLNAGRAMHPSRTWAIPVRRAEPVLTALREHGVAVTETIDPALPGTTDLPPALAPDDPFVIERLTRDLGRPPTHEELDQLRRDWYDTDKFPRRSD